MLELLLRLRPNALLLKQINHTKRPFSSAYTSSHPSYLQQQAFIAIRVIGYGLTLAGLLGSVSFVGTTLYLETRRPTSSSLPLRTRISQQFSRIFRDIDARQAHELLAQAFSFVDLNLEQLKAVKDPTFIQAWIDIARELAWSECNKGHMPEAAALYSRIISIPNIDPLIKSDVLRRLGELHITSKDYPSAIKLLREAIELAGGDINSAQFSSKISIPTTPLPSEQLVAAADCLASLYARQRDFKAALSTFLSILRAQRAAQQTPNPPSYAHPCIEAKTMSHLGEILWALGKKTNGINWVTASKLKAELGPNSSSIVECEKCIANASNVLGLMMENMNKLKEARDFYKEAFAVASRLGDINTQFDYNSNYDRVERKLWSKNKSGG